MYFITTITKEKDLKLKTTNTFGYFSELKRAKLAVRRNEGEMHECLYKYLVIEYIPEGIYGWIATLGEKQEYWYVWESNGKKGISEGKWIQTTKPEHLEGIRNFASVG